MNIPISVHRHCSSLRKLLFYFFISTLFFLSLLFRPSSAVIYTT